MKNSPNVFRSIRSRLLVVMFFGAGSLSATAFQNESDLVHHAFDQLLKKYVAGENVRYGRWKESTEDQKALQHYINQLSRQSPSKWGHPEGLAFWINLYNALTLNLILENYPVASIKDTGSLFKSPWNKKIISIEGKRLTLNNIENDIIRPQFKDARIHFALNCAALSCPPLAAGAFLPSQLNSQLDAATKSALQKSRWLKIENGQLQVTKIFDWYSDDFVKDSGSVQQFIYKYLPSLQREVKEKRLKLEFMSYNWQLNDAGPD